MLFKQGGVLAGDKSEVVGIVICGWKAPEAGVFMEWFFDGLGTMLIGLILGGAVGSTVTWRVMSKRSFVKQRQHAGDNATQMQVGRDAKGSKL